MTVSIWRYSHLTLAITSCIFLILASVTGVILAFEPIAQKAKPYAIENLKDVPVNDFVHTLKSNYLEVAEVTVDANHFVLINAIDNDGNPVEAYVNPNNGKIIGAKEKPNLFFQWVTNLHRSLFLHETGRILVGFFSFLLILISLSGIVLIIQRQQSFKGVFSKIIKENFYQYYHVVLGRLSVLIILIIASTGTVLTLVKFNLINEPKKNSALNFDTIKTKPKLTVQEFELFKNLSLDEVQKIEFPFSEEPEDHFVLQLKDKEITVNQFTGELLLEVKNSNKKILTDLSLDLHTGRTHSIWAIILAIASITILFFIYSGFAITLKRRKNKLTNKHPKEACETIILVGSENGSSLHYANLVQQALLKIGKKTFVTELNNYTIFPKATQFIIMTATYGKGNPPTNATQFLRKLKANPQSHSIGYSVLGFGSKSYPDFCQFAIDVEQAIQSEDWAKPLLNLHTVNDKSPADFEKWLTNWSQKTETPISIAPELLKIQSKPHPEFIVVDKTAVVQAEESFLIRFKPVKKITFTSGDLLAIFPASDHQERFYSIGKIKNEIQLSVKLHHNGLGSGFLNQLTIGTKIQARLDRNPHFHLNRNAKNILMISNGTGIAPFLGMIDENNKKIPIHLYCGFRAHSSYLLYENAIENYLKNNKLNQVHLAYSREGTKQYVKDLVEKDANLIMNTLKNNGIIMICGSLAMQNSVLEIINKICLQNQLKSVGYYLSQKQIQSDCY